MFENLDFSKMNEFLSKAEEQAKEFEEELGKREFSAKSGAGLVQVSANGKGEIIDVNIDNSLLEDKESLQILLISAINDVLSMVAQNKQSMVSNIFGGLKS
ncbi:nucleoid-associated protein, YbaB/EbfC family [Campylobacter sp. MIT 99-7217]|uniref:YbaB/EbfC family nucleoid-associated protein n=1 Tax=Campylobacter sp. MIT 99-7217 TaxID=535091 RepID=UPI001158AC0E|nr:YbaB/EbfC family nucleoid-associated protein [Campylobacter sp. MIT 99-7217]TQR32352.1 nucleoid-associated protein, YbaB/EbfC family [Campylobacter sp. MIT 99-7217]